MSLRKMKSTVSLRGNQLNWRNVTPDSDAFSLLVGSEEGGFLSLEEIDSVELENCGLKLGKDIPRDDADFTCGERPRATPSSSSRRKRKSKGIESEAKIEDNSNNAASCVKNRASSCCKESLGGPSCFEKRSKKRKKKQRQNASSFTQGSRSIVDLNVIDTQGTESRSKGTDTGAKAERAPKKQRGSTIGEVVGDAPQVILEDGASEGGSSCDHDLTDLSGWAELRLHPKLERALSDLKFREPTPIQRQCIPAAAHKGRDVIGAAETGSGKTLAFGLPILQRLMEEQDKISNLQTSDGMETHGGSLQSPRITSPLRALVVSPTRELALQICDHLRAAAKWTNVKIVPIVGGMSSEKQERLLKQNPEVIVGTPGRLWELMRAGETHLLDLHFLSFFVLDEADRMVEKGHFKELQSIIDLLPNVSRDRKSENDQNPQPRKSGFDTVSLKLTKRRQTLVFSATLALPADFKTRLKRVRELPKAALKSVESVASLSERAGIKPDAVIIDLTTSSIVAKQLSESVIECREEDKDLYLYYVLKVLEGGRTIVFCSSIAALRRVAAILRLLSVPVWPMHAQMQQKARLKAMERFRESGKCVLIATDVVARGIDVPDIRTVVHYQLPHSAEMYVHRSGRTARASTDGISIAFVSPGERAAYLKLCRALSRPQRLQPFPVNASYLPALEKRVLLALKLDKLLRKQNQTRVQDAWLTRNSREIEIDLESNEDDGEHSGTSSRDRTGVTGRSSPFELRRLQIELRDLVSQPLKPAAFSNRYVTGSGMTPLLTEQLRDYARAKTDSKQVSSRKGRLVVIGQEQMEPLAALRLANSVPCG